MEFEEGETVLSLLQDHSDLGEAVTVKALAPGRAKVRAELTLAGEESGLTLSASADIYVSDKENLTIPEEYSQAGVEHRLTEGELGAFYPVEGDDPSSACLVVWWPEGNDPITLFHKKGSDLTDQLTMGPKSGVSESREAYRLSSVFPHTTQKWQLEKVDGGYAIKSADDAKYLQLGTDGSFNHLPVGSTPYAFQIERGEDGGSAIFGQDAQGNRHYLANNKKFGTTSQANQDWYFFMAADDYTVDATGLAKLVRKAGTLSPAPYKEEGWTSFQRALAASDDLLSQLEPGGRLKSKEEADGLASSINRSMDELWYALSALEAKEEEKPGGEDQPAVPDGWHIAGNEKRYYQKGKALTGLQTIGKTTYLFDKEGDCQYGWHKVNGYACYFTPKDEASLAGGGLQTGLRKVGQTYYLFDSCESEKPGAKLEGWHKLNGRDYYFDPAHQGGMLTGLRKIGQTTYLFDQMASSCPGAKLSGWHRLNGRDYYFNPKAGGGMVTGIFTPNKVAYRFGGYESQYPGAKLGFAR